MLKGEPAFCLINVTAQDEQTLMDALRSILVDNQLKVNVLL